MASEIAREHLYWRFSTNQCKTLHSPSIEKWSITRAKQSTLDTLTVRRTSSSERRAQRQVHHVSLASITIIIIRNKRPHLPHLFLRTDRTLRRFWLLQTSSVWEISLVAHSIAQAYHVTSAYFCWNNYGYTQRRRVKQNENMGTE